MAIMSRASLVSAAFVKIADTLVADFDVFDLLHTLVDESVQILGAAAAGLVLLDPAGQLQVAASTSEGSQLMETLQLEAGAGPCVDCFRTGAVVAIDNIATQGSRWPLFQSSALSQGFRSLHAVPMRLHRRSIGALNLFGGEVGPLTSENAAIAQAFADVASISLRQERAARESARINEQLRHALNSRILIEQAKGVIAQSSRVDMQTAFARLRDYARSHNLTLYDTAERVVNLRITI
jgi:GAF domain-containing protein